MRPLSPHYIKVVTVIAEAELFQPTKDALNNAVKIAMYRNMEAVQYYLLTKNGIRVKTLQLDKEHMH